MKPFEILDRRMVLENPYCPVEWQRVEVPGGAQTDWYIVRSNDAVIIVPCLMDGRFVVEKAYKHGCGNILYEFPAGIIDAGETPEDAAHREMREETGYDGTMYALGSIWSNPTGSSMRYHIFYADGCTKVSDTQHEDTEQIETLLLEDIPSVVQCFLEGGCQTSSAALSALFLAQEFLNQRSTS